MKSLFILWGMVGSIVATAQVVTVSPIFPKADQPVTITVDVSGTSLDHFAWNNSTNPVYIWTWIEKGSADVDAPTNINPATAPGQDAAKCTRISTNPDKYQITFTPSVFFGRPASEITQIGLKLKSKDWNENKQTDNDKFVSFLFAFSLVLTQPTQSTLFVNTNDQIPITAFTSKPATLVFKVDGIQVATASNASTLNYTHTVTETNGSIVVTCEATSATSEFKSTTFLYVVNTPTLSAPRPPGIVDGINYQTDQTKVTLSLWAPGKNTVYLVGDFNDWELGSAFQMKKDGEHFWIELSGLTPGLEYAFQYVINDGLNNPRIADPYADKILDPDDSSIPAAAYPGLKPYPAKALSDKWYYNRVAVFQTGQIPYTWQSTGFQKPPAEKLVIYELLVRDFFDANARNYQNLIDTLNYIKRLGVNAIELMPVTEFNGNESWGYNPTFMFAPDKYYGTKDKLKEFIDVCHQNGIAVILDIVLNHQDTPNPYVMMDFDFTAFKPTANNKWFNVDAKHPYNVFFDMNHESLYTKSYLDTINYYWLNEYKVDGYRYDLSKGFTQQNNPTDVGAWGAYDATRIAIFKRMADKIRLYAPDAYLILEHFADNVEEKELADYGLMLWSNHNYAYNQNTMGYSDGSDFSWIFYGTRNWTVPHAVGYMESHDEERLMFKNKTYGNSSGTYNAKDLTKGLDRMKTASTMFYTIPGPKMLWQFGELGYDISIDQGGRVSPKPVKWTYLNDPMRRKLYDCTEALIALRNSYDVFHTTDVDITSGNSLLHEIVLKSDPYTDTPANTGEMNVVVIGNFDVEVQTISAHFPHTGNWYHYFSGGDVSNVGSTPTTITLQPGEARIYTDVLLPNPGSELVPYLTPLTPDLTSAVELDNGIDLVWTDHSTIETGYTVYRNKAGEGFVVVDELPINAHAYTSHGLLPLTTYDFYVEATNPYANSPSQTLTVTTSDRIVGLADQKVPLKVYPNPTDGLLSIDLPAEAGRVELRNSLGQVVSYHTVTIGHYDLSGLPGGLYLVSVEVGGRVRTVKVVVK